MVMLYSTRVKESFSSAMTYLECSGCGEQYDADQVQTWCRDCSSPLLAQYDLDSLKETLSPGNMQERPNGLWRWAELLPVKDAAWRVTLGEGDTPLLPVPRLGDALGLPELLVKDESLNPTGTFKARGLAVAVGRALELGVKNFVIPSAGNAGGALAAYAARAGRDAHVYMPADAPRANQLEVQAFGAHLRLVDGLIDAVAHQVKKEASGTGWFDFSTFKEPYRVEGKKTMGFEIAQAFDWKLPDVILYPTGGGTGLVGMWKSFDELQQLGWINGTRPRMVSVQAEGCAPIVRAFQKGEDHAETWNKAATVAAGLRVPSVFADRLVLKALYSSHGMAVAVSDADMLAAQRELASLEGIFASPEGGAALAGLKLLKRQGWIQPDEKVVLFNTGNGLKYI